MDLGLAFHGREDEHGADPPDVRDSRQLLEREGLVVRDVLCDDLDEVILLARDMVALENLREFLDLLVEILDPVAGVVGNGDGDEDDDSPPDPRFVHDSHVLLDDPLAFQFLDPFEHRWRCHSDLARQFGVRDGSVLLKDVEDLSVHFVDAFHHPSPLPFFLIFAMYSRRASSADLSVPNQ